MRIAAVPIVLALAVLFAGSPAPAEDVPATGQAVPGLAGYDQLMIRLITKWQIPGGAIGVARDGRLVLARAYGQANRDARQPVLPDALFRIASLSKSLTSAAILTLVEQGRLDLDAKAFRLLDLRPASGGITDPRMRDITVRDLLDHTGGWDRDASPLGDPMFPPTSEKAAQTLRASRPASCETIARFMLNQRLNFAPGTSYSYSNFGYCVLGLIIEKTTRQSYEDYVKSVVLAPLGITRMRLGHTRLSQSAPGEVRYYLYPGAPAALPSVFPDITNAVAAPYGGFHLEAMAANGGWIASTPDLLRFLTSLEGRRAPTVFRSRDTLDLMTARPPVPYWSGKQYYYAFGWLVRPTSAGANWWHNGSLPGTATYLVRAAEGWDAAVLFNSRPHDWGAMLRELDQGLWAAARQVGLWPDGDLFGTYQ